ncbi:MAG: hypothetical protein H0V17_08635 [Deltaproteobacteria bacterium]|nr:hypothetical protein [Deltaproteobacteria bacterium]
MKRALFVLATLGATTTVAYAQTKLLVLHADGKADARTRQKVDTAIVKLARSGPDAVTPGEITYAEAAAMVGCKPEDASCRDEVIDTLAVDELVIVNVNPKPPGFEIVVRRAKKGGAVHDASAIVAADKIDQVGALGPLFGVRSITVEPPPKPIDTKPIGPQPPIEPKPVDPKPIDTKPIEPKPVDTKPADPVPGIGQPDPMTKPAEPMRSDKQPKDRRRLQIAGMAGGGGMVFLSVILWASASGVQGQIDDAPAPRNRQDVLNLADLEKRGDSLANWGNFFFVGGLVLGGVSTYFYVRNKRARSSAKEKTAWFAPTLFDHGAGVTFTFQGAP